MVVTPAGDPCIIAVPYQGTLNFASFFAPKKVRRQSFVLCARALGFLETTLWNKRHPSGCRAAAWRSALPLATIGTQESKRTKLPVCRKTA